MTFYERIGQRVREAREAKGLSQEELGAALGYTATAISYFEAGSRKVRLEDLQRVAQVLDIDLDYLLPHVEDRASPVDIRLRASKRLLPDHRKVMLDFVEVAKARAAKRREDS
jgi:transcriptional regulator with XRE-family HTH domain